MRRKVFAIGHFKTGTSSYSEAMRFLGFVDLHFPVRYVRHLNTTGKVEWSPGFWAASPKNGGQYWVDVPWDSMSNINELEYPQLEEHYQDSLFVLTTRPVDAWLQSIKKHMSRRWHAPFQELFDARFEKIFGCPCNAQAFDEKSFREVFLRHGEEVRDYFSNDRAKRFLLLDLTDNDKMSKLANFVGAEIQYPKANVSHTRNRRKTRAHSAGEPVLLGGRGIRSFEQAPEILTACE